jgi:putative sigma-54 modulation protein
MNLQVLGRNVAVTPALREHAERKLARLDRKLNDHTPVDLTLSTERNPSIADRQIAEIIVQIRGEQLRVREAAADMHAAIDSASERMARLLARYQDQHRRRRPHHFARPAGEDGSQPDEAEESAAFDESRVESA